MKIPRRWPEPQPWISLICLFSCPVRLKLLACRSTTMNFKPLIAILFAPMAGLISCAGPDVRIVEANPELMYELGDTRSGEIVIIQDDKPKRGSNHQSGRGAKLRLPNMVGLPTRQELKPKDSSPSNSGGVISRPPSE